MQWVHHLDCRVRMRSVLICVTLAVLGKVSATFGQGSYEDFEDGLADGWYFPEQRIAEHEQTAAEFTVLEPGLNGSRYKYGGTEACGSPNLLWETGTLQFDLEMPLTADGVFQVVLAYLDSSNYLLMSLHPLEAENATDFVQLVRDGEVSAEAGAASSLPAGTTHHVVIARGSAQVEVYLDHGGTPRLVLANAALPGGSLPFYFCTRGEASIDNVSVTGSFEVIPDVTRVFENSQCAVYRLSFHVTEGAQTGEAVRQAVAETIEVPPSEYDPYPVIGASLVQWPYPEPVRMEFLNYDREQSQPFLVEQGEEVAFIALVDLTQGPLPDSDGLRLVTRYADEYPEPLSSRMLVSARDVASAFEEGYRYVVVPIYPIGTRSLASGRDILVQIDLDATDVTDSATFLVEATWEWDDGMGCGTVRRRVGTGDFFSYAVVLLALALAGFLPAPVTLKRSGTPTRPTRPAGAV